MIIPDLSADTRTSDNPLVTGDPYVRFYAGAPLMMADGHVTGALCVLDHQPRPEGLTPDQLRGLEALGRHVVELIETRRMARNYVAAVEARDNADAARAAVEHRWHGLFQNLNEGFILGRVVRDGEGRAIDWRYEQVNDAWYDLVGVPRGEAVGRTIREVFPGIEEDWVREMIDVAETGRSIEFTRQVGSLSRWYHGAAQPAGYDQFTILFLEVTDRVLATARQDALLQLGDRLRDRREVDAMVADAAEIVGRTLGADRAAYGEFFHEDQQVRLSKGWAKPGMPPIAGEYRFGDYGDVQEDIVSGRLLAIEDVLTDPRTAGDLTPWQALNIRAALLTAVMDRERPVAMLLVNWAEPHAITPEEIAFARNAADRLEIGIARQRTEDRQELLNGELAHRMKNSLSVVQAIAHQTLGGAGDREAVIAFGERLSALAAAHDVLLARSWAAADFGQVARSVLSTFDQDGRIAIVGPELAIGSRAALALSLLLHELATNAVKHGALSGTDGHVRLEWHVNGEADTAGMLMTWTERGGPPVVAPTKRGFGSRLIRMGLGGSGGSDARYGPAGLIYDARATLAQLRQA